MKISKEQVLQGFIHQFKAERDSLVQSAKAAHLAATHDESKAEDRHDTFAIESSYLAAGQAVRVAELEDTVREFEAYLVATAPHIQVGRGTLVTYDYDGVASVALIALLGGGSKIRIGSQTVQVLTLKSPLG